MGIGTTLGVVGGGLASAGIGAAASTSAANTQANAATTAAQLQYQAQQNALNQQMQMFGVQQANQAPFLQAGQAAVGTLAKDVMQPGGPFQPWTGQFTAPTAAQAAQTPGYQFALQQGLGALQANAAARGTLLTGGTGQALEQYAQGLASNTYQQTYNNALTQYQTAYNQFQQNQANLYNRLAGLSGTGQVAANTLGQQAGQMAGLGTQTYLQGAAQQGQSLQNAAAATASGYVGAANAGAGAFSNLGNYLTLYGLMNSQANQLSPADITLGNPSGTFGSTYNPAPGLSSVGAMPSTDLSGLLAPSSPTTPGLYGTAP